MDIQTAFRNLGSCLWLCSSVFELEFAYLSLLVVLSNNWHDFHVGLSNSLVWRAEIQK